MLELDKKFMNSLAKKEDDLSRAIQNKFNFDYDLNKHDISKLPEKQKSLSAAFLYGIQMKIKEIANSGRNGVEAERGLQLFIVL